MSEKKEGTAQWSGHHPENNSYHHLYAACGRKCEVIFHMEMMGREDRRMMHDVSHMLDLEKQSLALMIHTLAHMDSTFRRYMHRHMDSYSK